MTTLEPGASVVFTQGLVVRPRSTAFLARRPAASITDGFEVLVKLVMAAMTTWPWSTSNSAPPASFTGTGRRARSLGTPAGRGEAGLPLGSPTPVIPALAAGGSEAGK